MEDHNNLNVYTIDPEIQMNHLTEKFDPVNTLALLKLCPLYLGSQTSSHKLHLCHAHKRKCKRENYITYLEDVIQLGADNQWLTPLELNEIVLKQILWGPHAKFPAFGSRRNTTQLLKKYCREMHKKDPKSRTKPPNNSLPKSEFVQWAMKNHVNLDLERFHTRPYRKKLDKRAPYKSKISKRGTKVHVWKVSTIEHNVIATLSRMHTSTV